MSDLKIVHRPFFKKGADEKLFPSGEIWTTCLRQIIFCDGFSDHKLDLQKQDEIYLGLDAESFLAEILCGLKSPLIGETEVFGQFKNWWKSLPEDNTFKRKFRCRIETLFALVKMVREKALCGHGSQSYGSLLRKYIQADQAVDILGGGHLVQEILPWIAKKASYRLWCRDPEKVKNRFGTDQVLNFQTLKPLSPVVVVAAPLPHEELQQWLLQRDFSVQHKIFDLRADSDSFHFVEPPQVHLRLKDFSSEFDIHQEEIKKKAQAARKLIQQWRQGQEEKVQIRPYGWDDL